MAKIVRLSKDNEQIYPQTVTRAIADVTRKKTVEQILDGYDDKFRAYDIIIGSGSTTEFIDNLWELLQFFKDVKEAPDFKTLMDQFVTAEDAEDIASTDVDESADFPEFDEIFPSE